MTSLRRIALAIIKNQKCFFPTDLEQVVIDLFLLNSCGELS
jgi:hypothetical protein